MTFRAYKLYRYRIPVDSQLVLRNHFLKVREGLIININCGDKQGFGEIAPLLEFSRESLEQAQSQTQDWLIRWNQARINNQKLSMDGLYPSVAFGLSCALAELVDKLQPEGNYQVAPLCYGDPDELFAKLDNIQGEKIAKIKVGLYEANRDGMVVNMFLEAIPDLQLRLDANRAWTLAKAQLFAKYIAPEFRSRIQFIEEPCRTPAASLEFAKMTGINIAWDESLRDLDFNLQAQPYLKAIVIKPTLIGSIEKCLKFIHHAQSLDLRTVISSSIESSLGLTQLARLSAQYCPKTTAGLDTLNLMAYQLLRPWQGSELPLLSLENTEFVELVAQQEWAN